MKRSAIAFRPTIRSWSSFVPDPFLTSEIGLELTMPSRDLVKKGGYPPKAVALVSLDKLIRRRPRNDKG
jgi:hypothetical protein